MGDYGLGFREGEGWGGVAVVFGGEGGVHAYAADEGTLAEAETGGSEDVGAGGTEGRY